MHLKRMCVLGLLYAKSPADFNKVQLFYCVVKNLGYLIDFILGDLSSDVNGVLRSPTIIVFHLIFLSLSLLFVLYI